MENSFIYDLVDKSLKSNKIAFYVKYSRGDFLKFSLREKCPNTEVFLVCIFPYLDWIRGDTVQMRENTDQKNLRILTLFTQCF